MTIIINILNIMYCINDANVKFIKIGNKNVNSISYKIKNTHKIEKFKFICMFMSVVDLNPHS
jgi:hypothetical protein